MKTKNILGKKEGDNLISRRGFLELAGISTVMAGGTLAGCAPQQSSELADTSAGSSVSQSPSSPSFLVAPDPIDEAEIAEVIETEVLVIGAGITGISAARSAAESGAKVVVVEKGESYGVRSSKYGAINSSIHKQLGQPELQKAEVVNALQRQMNYRADSQLLNYWADHSGEDFDWWCEPVEFAVLENNTDQPPADAKLWLKPTHWPHDASYDWRSESAPCVIGELAFCPDGHLPVCEANAKVAQDLGAEFIFSTFAR